MATSGRAAVDALGGLYGRHPCFRAAHARGIVCHGTFTATPAAARLTSAEHMQGHPVEAIVRFSNSSGDPAAPDWARDARGLAVKFELADGATDVVAVSLPCFFVRRPDDFVPFTRAITPNAGTGRRDRRRVLRYLTSHPEAWRAVWALLRSKHVPSYANCRYNAIHAFRWVDGAAHTREVRYTWEPEEGERRISPGAAVALGPGYLQDEILHRLPDRPLRFRLRLQLAGPRDRVDDPTAVWRRPETVDAGTLEVTRLGIDRDQRGAPLVFDPMRLTDGIEPSADPVLAFRPAAYGISAEQRSLEPLPARRTGRFARPERAPEPVRGART